MHPASFAQPFGLQQTPSPQLAALLEEERQMKLAFAQVKQQLTTMQPQNTPPQVPIFAIVTVIRGVDIQLPLSDSLQIGNIPVPNDIFLHIFENLLPNPLENPYDQINSTSKENGKMRRTLQAVCKTWLVLADESSFFIRQLS